MGCYGYPGSSDLNSPPALPGFPLPPLIPQGIFFLPLYWTVALVLEATTRPLDPSLERPPDTAIDEVLYSAPDRTPEPAQGRILWLVLRLVLGPA